MTALLKTAAKLARESAGKRSVGMTQRSFEHTPMIMTKIPSSQWELVEKIKHDFTLNEAQAAVFQLRDSFYKEFIITPLSSCY